MDERTTRRTAALLAAALVLALACLAGCATGPAPPGPGEPEQYRIGPGDLLAVKLFYTPELNEDVRVRPDGRISLQLVGEVSCADRTPEELTEELRERYGEFLTAPEVVVQVTEFRSQRAYVGGEVRQPSIVPIDGRMTVADAVVAAQGALLTAELSSVVLLRRGAEGREAYRVDVEAGLRGETDLPVLRPYDVVYVPKSVIAEVGEFVELYINRLLPRNASFIATYELHNGGLPID